MNWTEAESQLQKDSNIGPLIRRFGHCSIKKRPKSRYYISLVRAIIGQQLSVKAAATIYGRLEDLLNSNITPGNVLTTHGNSFRKAGLSRGKVVYIKDLAQKVQNNEVEIYKMDKLDNEIVVKELVAVKGIGQWTAEMFLMFSLARPDIFPIDDLGLRNGFKKTIGNYKPENMVRYAKRWSPYRSVASWYLWRSLEVGPPEQIA
ncbi:DNA-3-methyladenine glycosylase family protein [Patescibacteria group bacterium]